MLNRELELLDNIPDFEKSLLRTRMRKIISKCVSRGYVGNPIGSRNELKELTPENAVRYAFELVNDKLNEYS